jgi:hypothetical protein
MTQGHSYALVGEKEGKYILRDPRGINNKFDIEYVEIEKN